MPSFLPPLQISSLFTRLLVKEETEKREAQKEQGRNNIPECDGQIKHPEHVWRHDHLQILQREALKGNVEKCREMILELPEYQRKDITEMMIKSVANVGRKLDL